MPFAPKRATLPIPRSSVAAAAATERKNFNPGLFKDVSRFTTLIALLGGVAILLLGNGLFGTLLGVRASLEGFSLGVTGAIMSAYFLGYVGGSFLCVGAIARVGHIRTFAALSATLAATAIAHAIFVVPPVWGLFRLVTGVCIVGVFLVIESWLNSVTPQPLRGRVFSLYMTVNLLAMATGQFLLTLADPKDFVLFGLVSILFALSLLPTTLTRLEAPTPENATGLTLRELYAASPVGVIGCLACGFVSAAFWGMGPVYGKMIGLQEIGVATFMSCIIVGGMLAQWPIGAASDRMDRRKVIIAVAASGAAAAALIALFTSYSVIVMLGLSTVFGACLFPLYSLAVARTHDVLGAGKVLEATRGLILVFGIGAVAGPLVAGWVMESLSPPAMFVLFGGILGALALFAVYRAPRGEEVPTEAQTTFVPILRTSQQGAVMAEQSNVATEST